MYGVYPCVCMQGLEPELVARFTDFQFSIDVLRLDASADLPPALHTTALRNALRQLEGLRVSKSKPVQLRLHRWQWDTETVRAFLAAVPVLAEFGIHTDGRISTDISDEQLSLLLSVAPGVLPKLNVVSLKLQSDTHANTPWPWEELTVHEFYVLKLLRYPWPGGDGAPRKVAAFLLLDASIREVRCGPHTHTHTHADHIYTHAWVHTL